MSAVLDLFGPATRAWFTASFAAPTRVQVEGWPPLAAGEHALLTAPTGSGKTLAAFLAAIDRLARRPAPREPGVSVLYVSPLKALAYDVERNLRAPLVGIGLAAARVNAPFRDVSVAVRTGDTPGRERARLVKEPGEILITTPESLYLMLGSRAAETLRRVETVIVDEIHALAPTKRGAHLALSLERLVELAGEFQRVGLSATARPLDEVARFLGGDRPVGIVDAGEPPRLDLTLEVPVEDMERPFTDESGRDPEDKRGMWPAIHPRLLELVKGHRSTIVFTNSRRLCERLAQSLNELDGGEAPLLRAHHGSIARAQREEIEEQLKRGQLRGIVATSSLELGIDMGAVDLVVQIESPGAVSRGLQRIGRAGHHVGGRSIGRVFPKHRGDLLEATVVAHGMLAGDVEPLRVPKNALDVLAQQIVAAGATGEHAVTRLEAMIRRAYPYRELPRALLGGVLDMLAGRYPAEDFAELRPRIVWDRVRDTVVSRRDAKLIATTSGGTIPDRGLYAVHLGASGPRIGELDEEMVHETRAGQTFFLGASTWRVAEITRDRVIVTPAPGEPGKLPFWRGEGPGRPLALGRALGAFVRTLADKPEADALRWLIADYHLDEKAAGNLWRYVREQHEAVGALPTDHTVTVERFRDELGDWRVCILTPFGARVHAPWALALQARLGAGVEGREIQAIWSDDGIALRLAETDEPPESALLFPDPEEIEELVVGELGRSSLFATHFRENAARALLLPRRRGATRTPLWAQRLRAGNLLAVASKHPSFPIVLETYRECLHDVFDLPALTELLAQVRRRELRVESVETRGASPFARTLAYAYVAAFIYEGDLPLAERKAQALALDRGLLRELLGQEELRDLLDADALAEVEAELQLTAEDRRARHADGLADALRRLGDLDEPELAARAESDPKPWLAELAARGRAVAVRVAGKKRWIAVEDVARYRDALGVQPPAGLPSVFLEPQPNPLEGLVVRYARTHGPFTLAQLAARLGLLPAQVEAALRALVASGRVLEGEFRPGKTGLEFCDAEVLRVLRRRTLARLRGEVAPVEAPVLARFLDGWHGLGAKATLRDALDKLEGLPLPFSELERTLLPARVPNFHPRMLDELGALGEIVWLGRGALGGEDGRVLLVRRDRAHLVVDLGDGAPKTPVHEALLAHLTTRGASFFAELRTAVGGVPPDEVLAALWDLVWAGEVTNDTFQPLRALAAARRGRGTTAVRAGGRWSSTRALVSRAAPPTERAHAQALMLLERHGIVSREAVAAEDLAGGFQALSPVLRAMEDSGRIRRGHFVDGLTGAQYAHAGAVDRLRAARDLDDPAPRVLAAVDPANPYGAVLPWPAAPGADAARPRRVSGARVVLVRGEPVFWVDKGGARLVYFPGDADLLPHALDGLRAIAARRRHRELRVTAVNGVPALRSEHSSALEQAGFRVAPDALVLAAPQGGEGA